MSIRDLLEAKANELAEHDGVAVTVVHLHAAVAQITAELRREFDMLVAGVRPAGAPVEAPIPEAPQSVDPVEPDGTTDVSDSTGASPVAVPVASEPAAESAS